MSDADDREAKDAPGPVELATRFALTLEEAALAFSISPGHLRNHLSEVPHLYIGTRLVFPVKPAEEWLRDRAQAKNATSERITEEVLRELKKNQ